MSNHIVHDMCPCPYPLFLSSFLQCENSDDNISYGSDHAIPIFSFFLFYGLAFLFAHPVIQVEFKIVILLWIQCILALITGRESVIPSCAYPGFPGIRLCGLLCLLSLCTLVTSGSPCEPILLLSLLIYDMMNALCCLTHCLGLHHHFHNYKAFTLLKCGYIRTRSIVIVIVI